MFDLFPPDDFAKQRTVAARNTLNWSRWCNGLSMISLRFGIGIKVAH